MKIAVLTMPDMHYFLDGIEKVFREAGHEVRRNDTGKVSDIEEALAWADAVWCEFANEVAAYVTREKRRARVVVRLHSYEAYGAHVRQVTWRNADLLIHTSEHVLQIAKMRAPLDGMRKVLIPSCIDTDKFTLPEEPGDPFRIGVVAWVRPEKNPYAWLQILAELRRLDARYTLDVAGTRDFEATTLYLHSIARDLELGPMALRFHDHVEDMPAFWLGKGVCLSASTREGHPYNVLEAAACGVAPVVHRYLGAAAHFPEEWLWTRQDEAIGRILNPIEDREALRAFVVDGYSLARWTEPLLAAVTG